jgi:single-strand DNA-binding protein
MRDALVTVVGRLTAEPTWGYTKNEKVVFVNFDVAVNHGYFDRERGHWIESGASFFRVSAFRNLAVNAIESLHKGTPVVVQGKLRIMKWENGERQGTNARIEAVAIGPDLNFGQADFTAVKRPQVSNSDPMEDANVVAAGASAGADVGESDDSDGHPTHGEGQESPGEPPRTEEPDEQALAVGA